MSKKVWFLPLIIMQTILVQAQSFTNSDQVFREAFDTVNGTFVLYDLEENSYYYFNEERANTRYPPMSTFKIPNSLIALETGVLENANSMIEWDSTKVPCNPDWNAYLTAHWCKDQTLASAFKYSVVWFYQEVARRIGPDRMQAYVKKIKYGNNDTEAGIDNFWFWKLKISAKEQVEFLKNFYLEDIDFDPDHIDIVKDIMVREETENYVLYGKTGGGNIGDRLAIGWMVGFVETGDNVYIYAMNVEGPDFSTISELRIKIAEEVLTLLGIL